MFLWLFLHLPARIPLLNAQRLHVQLLWKNVDPDAPRVIILGDKYHRRAWLGG